MGVDLSGRSLGKYEASRMIERLSNRRKKGQATYKMARQLARVGLPTEVDFDTAKEWIGVIAANGWRCPEELRIEAWEAVAA